MPREKMMAKQLTKQVSKSTNHDMPDELNTKLDSVRCCDCGRFLCLQAIIEGTVAIRCRRCKKWTILDIHSIDGIKSSPEVDQGLDHFGQKVEADFEKGE